MLMPHTFDRNKHYIVGETPFLSFLRREFPEHKDDFLIYRHMQTKQFVVAGWTHRMRGRMVDLILIGKDNNPTKEHVRELTRLLRPAPGDVMSGKSLKRQLDTKKRAEDNEWQENQEELLDAKRVVFKHHIKDGSNPFWDDVRHRTLIPQRG